MCDVHDLPLFTWRKVLLFPVARQARKVRDTAAELVSRNAEDVAAYGRLVTLGIQRRLVAQGFGDAVIQHEVYEFWKAVEIEMARIVYGRRQSPDGAA